MKITNLSTDQLELKEGSASGITVGVAVVIAGALVGDPLHNSNQWMIWIALAMVVIGIALVLLSSSITVNACKSTGQLRYQKKRLDWDQGHGLCHRRCFPD